ncbi:MAG: SEC-C domain-containing protein [Gammaproteobacteria bacterium]|nr:SEC-C domain-containing protein [Gammaproteobacteria bacterium]
MNEVCPCGSGMEYPSCCGRYLDAGEFPQRAEQLMRSRYCAYVLARADYLLATWHTSTRPPSIQLDINGLTWLGLKVIHAHDDSQTASVEFVARHKLNGKAHRLHEVSRFVKEHGRWLYVNGDIKH